MTEENYNYRTSQTLLRNQFSGKGKLRIPIIPKFQEKPGDFDNLLLIGFDKTHLEDQNHLDRIVHFFLYDYRFERVWKNPDNDIEKLSRYRAVLSPDFSMYLEMAPVMQLYNVFRNRWCGTYWASKGMRVIPTVNWGDESTFDFCFEGIEKGCAVAVSTYMASEHGNRQDQKEWFMAGYNEMLRRIEPEKIICYNTPFPEMQGNIVYVDYELSSWKYMSCNLPTTVDLEAFKIGGSFLQNYDTMSVYMIGKGGGSAYGGQWRPNPNKPQDSRYLGTPGEIKITIMRNGDVFKTKIGPDGRAEKERHETDHNRSDMHTDPHDHDINWGSADGHPIPRPPINYPSIVPEFKTYHGGIALEKDLIVSSNDLKFESISEFKWSMRCNCELTFEWNGVVYGVMPADYKGAIAVYKANMPESEIVYKTADDALEYMIGKDRLRDVITQINVLSRTV